MLHTFFRTLIFFLSILSSVLLFNGCYKEPGTTPLLEEVRIQVLLPAGYSFHPSDSTLKIDSIVVHIRGSKSSHSALCDSNGWAMFTNIMPDLYSISALLEVKDRVSITGQISKGELFRSQILQLNLREVIEQSLVVSKIYTSGCKDNQNANYTNDVYIEFFNNSNSDVILDSTYYFAFVESMSPPSFVASADPDHVYCRQVFRLISDGSTRILAPGQSIVVCNYAQNHLLSASLSVNLLGADYEAKNASFSNNNALVPAVQLIHSAFPSIVSMNLSKGGLNGVLLIQTSDYVGGYLRVPHSLTSANPQYYMKIHVGVVLDGIEVLQYSSNGVDALRKRIGPVIDAGFKNISNASGLNSETIVRKRIVRDGQIRLMDSNNSTLDCQVITNPTARNYNY